jgi:hypothetical protein
LTRVSSPALSHRYRKFESLSLVEEFVFPRAFYSLIAANVFLGLVNGILVEHDCTRIFDSDSLLFSPMAAVGRERPALHDPERRIEPWR